ncbi:MAG TPA: AAA family ATPase [Gemmataceae bacterium]|nr:AAA family ATPase [Gemmataceae bacterium]
MKIHSARLRNVRQIKDLLIDLSAPLTVVSGPNGVGKTTLQEAILGGLFFCPKDARDSLVSKFDPDTKPTVVLELWHGEAEAGIVLTRTLTDDQGTWQEGTTTLKKKKEALEKIQETLPLSAQAAALLLWGRQDNLAAVIEKFPADGHSLLTAATLKGSGPDPKEIVKDLDKEIENARKGEKGGQTVGALTGAKKRVASFKEEWDKAKAAEEDWTKRREQFDKAKTERDQIQARCGEKEKRIAALAAQEKLLGPALQDMATLANLEETQSDWESLEEEIAAAGKNLTGLEKELTQLHSRYRFTRDQELGQQIDNLRARIAVLEELEKTSATLEKDIQSRPRPGAAEVAKLHALKTEAKEAQDRMEASGVRYELSVAAGSRTVRIAEDGGPEKEIVLTAGKKHADIVGRLVVEADGLRFTAGGKEDISRHKRVWENNSEAIQGIFKQFACADEAAFLRLAEEKGNLEKSLKEKKNEWKAMIGGCTPADLRAEIDQLEQARAENRMTLQDREAWSGKVSIPAADIANQRSRKEGEIEQARETQAEKEAKKPTDTARNLHKANLEAVRKKCRESVAAFKDADDLHREPGKMLLQEIKSALEKNRAEFVTLSAARTEIESHVAELQGQLKLANPHRPLSTIEADLQQADQVHHREQVLQDARALLKERIEEKMTSMAAHVPVDLGNRITEHLAKLSAGAFHQVQLNAALAVDQVGENGNHGGQWQPAQLSHGQRHQAALAVKIAVARALAETSGPVFIMLDDSLVSFDPQCRAAAEKWLLDLVADEKLQVILLTCHSDWAADWHQRSPEVKVIELAKEAQYYRDPPAIAAGAELSRV